MQEKTLLFKLLFEDSVTLKISIGFIAYDGGVMEGGLHSQLVSSAGLWGEF